MNRGKTEIVDVIAALDLQPHVEGGYFRRTFKQIIVPCCKPPVAHVTW